MQRYKPFFVVHAINHILRIEYTFLVVFVNMLYFFVFINQHIDFLQEVKDGGSLPVLCSAGPLALLFFF
jgi:hypothetical protein